MKAMSMGYFNGKIGNAHAPCHVTVVGGHPNHIFGISDPNLPIHYVNLWVFNDD